MRPAYPADPPRRTGKPSTGRRGTGDGTSTSREVCVMQNAETVLDVLRERGRRGLPIEGIYRQLFNPQLYLLAYGRIYSNKGAMTPGPDAETADGMTMGKIDAHHRRGASRALPIQARPAPSTSPRRTGSSGRWVCRHGRTSCSAKWSACCWRRTTSRGSPSTPTVTAPAGVATPPWARWPAPGPGRAWFIEGDISQLLRPTRSPGHARRRWARRSAITGCSG